MPGDIAVIYEPPATSYMLFFFSLRAISYEPRASSQGDDHAQ